MCIVMCPPEAQRLKSGKPLVLQRNVALDGIG